MYMIIYAHHLYQWIVRTDDGHNKKEKQILKKVHSCDVMYPFTSTSKIFNCFQLLDDHSFQLVFTDEIEDARAKHVAVCFTNRYATNETDRLNFAIISSLFFYYFEKLTSFYVYISTLLSEDA
ncbi:hypothetical protein K501DRAFT_280002 [Backusella circina FSU 941]|nr:hypothetical protein K501DRAFT_280002 [Backusella circina FSU 941]